MKARDDHARLLQALTNPSSVRSLGEQEWSRLIASARKANVLGGLAENMLDDNIPVGTQVTRHLLGARQLSVRQRQSVLWEMHQLQSALGKLDIPVVLLKGAAYVMSQDAVARGRLFGDIDIMVPRERIGDVESELMLHGWISAKSHAYDQRYYRQWMHEIPPMVHVHRGTVLDVHHTLLPLTARHAPDPRQIVARSRHVSIPGLDALRVPCPEDLVIHSLVHLVHEGELHNGLRDLRDIDCMLRHFSKATGFWLRIGQYAGGNDLARPVLLGLHLVRAVFQTPIPDQLLLQLREAEGSGKPSRMLVNCYLHALAIRRHDESDWQAAWASGLIYLRAHALRMPMHMLVRHLITKAWMGMREKYREQESPT